MVEIGMPMLALDQTWSQRRAFHSRIHTPKPTVMDRKFIDEVVAAHNAYRSCHQAGPLSQSRELSITAQKWADQLASTNSFQHSNSSHRGQPLGENIAMKWSSRPDAYTGQEVTDQWYGEVKMYTFGGEPRTLNSGHFTQVVWKGSKEIGVGKAQTRDGKIIVVANYLPAGNMIGEYSYNVLPPKDGKITLPQPAREKPHTTFGGGDFSSVSRFNNNTEFPKGEKYGNNSSSTTHSFDDFNDMKRSLFGGSGYPTESISTRGYQSRGESRSTRTFTVTEGHGANKVTKIIEEETITKPDGSKITNRKETVKNDNDGNQQGFGSFGNKPFANSGSDRFRGIDPSSFDTRGGIGNFGGRFNRNASDKPSTNKDYFSGSRQNPQTMTQFIDGCVRAHNALRTKHGVPGLKHCPELSDYAQKWAEQLAATDSFQHSQCNLKGQRLGENIACKWSSGGGDYTSEEAVEQWYSEISKHDYSSQRSLGTGHFTQVVWKDSKEVGIGKARAAGGKIVVVASYRPAGNVIGHYKENVFPPK
ncbi:hypothetical protein SNE40_001386 [Patella caerulea]|uniref:SCP domain-containing protein n=1 Tax=Patella caerulea TaxID=87958 RepID=A0AAN8KDW7_PATCE